MLKTIVNLMLVQLGPIIFKST